MNIVDTDFDLNTTDKRKAFIGYTDSFIYTLHVAINEDLYERQTGKFLDIGKRFGLKFSEQIDNYTDSSVFFRQYKQALYAFLCRLKAYPIPTDKYRTLFAAQYSVRDKVWVKKEDFDTTEDSSSESSTTSSSDTEPENNDENISETLKKLINKK